MKVFTVYTFKRVGPVRFKKDLRATVDHDFERTHLVLTLSDLWAYSDDGGREWFHFAVAYRIRAKNATMARRKALELRLAAEKVEPGWGPPITWMVDPEQGWPPDNSSLGGIPL